MMGNMIAMVMAIIVSLSIAAIVPVVFPMFVVRRVFMTFATVGELFLVVRRGTLRFILTVFVWFRVHGRSWSFVPPNLNKRIRDAQQLSRQITEQTGVAPADNELAEKLGITVEELYETFENARAQHFMSLDDSGEDSPALGSLMAAPRANSPDERIERAELIGKLTQAIEQLFAKQRQVVLLYYQQQLTMKQIAEILEITESRVSQLHASALFSLSIKLRQWNDGGL